jgi:hypothetical protein
MTALGNSGQRRMRFGCIDIAIGAAIRAKSQR